MGTYTIVAIPSEDDYVWKISSEKIPHLTILQLDDHADLVNVFNFVEHVVKTTMCRFGMDVDHRGTLGPKDADVLFFNTHYAPQIKTFRSNLLKNQTIFTAYNATEQYDTWTPHLTLGYPSEPAKEDTRDYPGIRWVNFDKIAIWTTDYEGPEFQLPAESFSGTVAYGEEFVENALSHFGVKGMKWGVRHDPNGTSLPTAIKKLRQDPTKTTYKSKAAAVGGLHKVSDDELQAMLTRLEREKKFQQFMDADNKRRQEGAKAVLHILGQIGKIALPIALGVVANRVANNASAAPFRTTAYVDRLAIES